MILKILTIGIFGEKGIDRGSLMVQILVISIVIYFLLKSFSLFEYVILHSDLSPQLIRSKRIRNAFAILIPNFYMFMWVGIIFYNQKIQNILTKFIDWGKNYTSLESFFLEILKLVIILVFLSPSVLFVYLMRNQRLWITVSVGILLILASIVLFICNCRV